MRKYVLLKIICILIISVNINAQDLEKFHEVIPPSPSVAALMKFTDIPVSYNTGVPNISVPLWVMQGKQLQLPISISYHASGIKVNQLASWVGLGWALSAGGTIARVKKGNFDEHPHLGYWYTMKVFNGPKQGELFSEQWIDEHKFELLLEKWDTEPDFFSFNFMGYTGHFVIDADFTNSPKAENVHTIPYLDLKIEPILNNDKIVGFEITTPDGIVCKFGGPLATESTQLYTVGSAEDGFNSAWHITEVIAPNKEQLLFEYSNDNSDVQIGYSMSYYTIFATGDIDWWMHNFENYLNISTYFYLNQSRKLSKISLLSREDNLIESIEIEATADRLDIHNCYKLNKIKILDKNNESLKSYSFKYSYFHSGGPETENYRLKLDTIIESNAKNKKLPPYVLNYNTGLPSINSLSQDYYGFYNARTNSSLVPGGFFDERYLHGANREPNPEVVDNGLLTRIIYPTGGSTHFKYEMNDYHSLTEYQLDTLNAFGDHPGVIQETVIATKEIFTDHPQHIFISLNTPNDYFILRLTNLNTNQVSHLCRESNETLFELKANEYYRFDLISYYSDAEHPSNPYCMNNEFKTIQEVVDDPPASFSIIYETNQISSKRLIGGARIKQIDYYTDKLVKSTYYDYIDENTGYSSGLIYNGKPVFHNYIEHLKYEDLGPSVLPRPHTATFLVRTGNNLASPVLGINPHVVYKNISVTNIKYDSQFNIIGNSGKTEYKYNYNVENAGGTYPYGGIKNSEWKYGNLIKTSHLNTSGDTVSYSSSDYQEQGFESPKYFQLLGFKLAWEKRLLSENEQDYYSVDGIIYDQAVHKTYAINTNVLNKITENNALFDLSTNEKIIDSMLYEYDNNYNFIKKQIHYFPNGDSLTTNSYYPFDNPTDVSAPIANMEEKNIIGTVLKTETFNNKKKVSGIAADYQLFGDIIVPSKKKVLEGEDYVDKMIYDEFDIHGNLLQFHLHDNINTSIYWGYNKRYPIAKIAGIVYSALPSNVITELNMLDNPDLTHEQLNLINNSIRDALPNCMVNTYTYEESIGITSETDPNGKTTFYEYDDFGRLKLVRDYNENIIKKYTYEYQAGSNLPTGFEIGSRDSYQIELKWDENSEVDKYNLYLLDNNSKILLYSDNSTSFQHSNLTPNTFYNYQLTTVKNGLESKEVSLAARTKMLPPSTPDLNLSCSSTSAITLSWDDISGESRYVIYRGASVADVNDSICGLSENTTSYINTNLTAGTTYYYRIAAVNEDHSISSETKFITTVPPTPGIISGEISPCISSTQIYEISLVKGATSYEWIVPNGWTIISGENSRTLTVKTSNTLGNVQVRAGNSSGFSLYSIKQISPVGEPIVQIGGPNEVAGGLLYNFSVLSEQSSSSFNWSVPVGCTITNGMGTSDISVRWGTSAGIIRVNYNTGICVSFGEKNVSMLPPLSAPSLSISCLGTTSALLNWQDIERETGYRIYDDATNTIIKSLNENVTSCTILGLTPGQTYSYRLEAYNAYDSKSTLPKEITILSNAPNLSANPVSNTRIDISWTNVVGAYGYKINFGTQPTIIVGSQIHNYSFSGLNSNTSYNISIKAFNNSCESATANTSCTTLLNPPAAPSLTLSCSSANAISLNWNAVSGATSYKIYRGTSSSNVNTLVTTLAANVLSYTNSGLSAGTTYYYKVQVFNANNNNVSQVKSITTVPPTPGAISGEVFPCIASTQVYTVSAVNGATTYQWTVPQGWTIVSGQNSRSLTVTVSSTIGNIQIRAGNSSGYSSYSSRQISPQGKPTVQIGGPSEVVANSLNNFSVLSSPNSSSFVWSIPSGCTITSGMGTDYVTVKWGSTAGIININYKTGVCNTHGEKMVTIKPSSGGGGGGILEPIK